MMWIRGPLWDCTWILSAPALGLLLLLGVPHLRLPWLAIIFTANFAHALAPICLAWAHQDYRREVMLVRPAKFIGIPAALLACGALAAVLTAELFPGFDPRQRMVLEYLRPGNLGVPLVVLANIYAIWNLYHAGAQNYGLWCLYRRRGYRGLARYAVLGAALALTLLMGLAAPRFGVPMLFVIGAVFLNHYLAAIGLAAHVHSRSHSCSPIWFVLAVVAIGCPLAWLFFGVVEHGTLIAAALALGLRGSLGMWHFLQDRWVWKMSDPRVRATIGLAFSGR